MVQSHCTEPGTGAGPGSNGLLHICYAELFTLHLDMEWDWTPLGFIPIFPFPIPFSVLVPCSMNEPLLKESDNKIHFSLRNLIFSQNI